MLEVERGGDLVAYQGKEIGVSDWYTPTRLAIISGSMSTSSDAKRRCRAARPSRMAG
jgi:hypothetical protein